MKKYYTDHKLTDPMLQRLSAVILSLCLALILAGVVSVGITRGINTITNTIQQESK